MSPVTIAVVVTLVLWWLATAIVQLPFARCRRLHRYDPVSHLTPGWSFFAPDPAPADFAVWYRSWPDFQNDRGEVDPAGGSAWVELAGIDERRLLDGLVYPGHYARKTIFTSSLRIVSLLATEDYRSDPRTGLPSDAVLLGIPYLLVLNKVTLLSAPAMAVQFRIDGVVHRSEGPVTRTVFTSAVHRRDPQRPADGREACDVVAS